MSDPGALPGFVFWRVAADSGAVKISEILTGVAVGVLQRSDAVFERSRVDSRSAALYFPFFKSCTAMA